MTTDRSNRLVSRQLVPGLLLKDPAQRRVRHLVASQSERGIREGQVLVDDGRGRSRRGRVASHDVPLS